MTLKKWISFLSWWVLEVSSPSESCPPPTPKGKDFKRKRDGKFQIFGTQFYFPTSLSQSKENIGSEILLQNYVYGLTLKKFNEHFFSSKIHLHVDES